MFQGFIRELLKAYGQLLVCHVLWRFYSNEKNIFVFIRKLEKRNGHQYYINTAFCICYYLFFFNILRASYIFLLDIERRKDSIQRITDNTSHNILVTEHNLTPKEVATAKERVPLDDLERNFLSSSLCKNHAKSEKCDTLQTKKASYFYFCNWIVLWVCTMKCVIIHSNLLYLSVIYKVITPNFEIYSAFYIIFIS